MSKLKVENFGPITTGYTEDDGFMDFRKVTVFIGNQGSGKSSVAKLFSTMSWLEKALFQGRVTEKYITSYNRFVKKYCGYFNLANYFREETVIEYRGKAFNIDYKAGKLFVIPVIKSNYKLPKIMYVPAERNFLSAVDEPDKLKGLPSSLLEFWEELREAQRALSAGWQLPLGNVRFEYDKSNQIPWIAGTTAGDVPFRLRLSESSSGFQSLVPMLLVSRNLALSINREQDASRSELSAEERRRLREQIDKIYHANLPAAVEREALEALGARFRREVFINVVEEPEQNLFPSSQRAVLYELVAYTNLTSGNELVITTHSPYIINYLTLAIKAYEVKVKIASSAQNEKLQRKLAEIVPAEAEVAAREVVVYELADNGQITRLPMENGVLSDENDLNEALGATNSRFSDLLRIEQYAQRG